MDFRVHYNNFFCFPLAFPIIFLFVIDTIVAFWLPNNRTLFLSMGKSYEAELSLCSINWRCHIITFPGFFAVPSYVIAHDIDSLLRIYFSQALGHKVETSALTECVVMSTVSISTHFPEASVTVYGVNNANWGVCIHQWLQRNLLDQTCIAVLPS